MSASKRPRRMSAEEALKAILREGLDSESDMSEDNDSETEEKDDDEEMAMREMNSEPEDNVEANSDYSAEERTQDESGDSESSDESSTEDDGSSTDQRMFKSKSGYIWKANPPITGRARAHNIVKERMGLKGEGKVGTIQESLGIFLTTEMKEIIVRFTNQKAHDAYEKWNREHNDNRKWREIDQTELDAFIGLLIYAGVLLSSKEDLREIWKMEDCGRPIFRATMGLGRFQNILRFLRFDDLQTRPDRRKKDKLAPFRGLLSKFQATLQRPYKAGANLTVDEQLVRFRGRCPFRQYMPSKPAKYGIKWWLCCDSENAYVCSLDIYLGKQEGQRATKNVGEKVVADLT